MSPVAAVVLLVAVNAVTVTVMLLLRRRAPEGSYFRDTQQAAGVFTVAGTAYAVLLAFVFLLAFQSFNSARTAGEQEATAVTALYHAADGFAEPTRRTLHGQLVCYGRSVVYSEWAAMGDDRSSPLTQSWVDHIDATYAAADPRTDKQQDADSAFADRQADRLEGRRGRLQEAGPLIPGIVWALLVIGSLVVVGFVLFFADRRERAWVQAMLMLSVTTMLAAGLLLIKFFDAPYADVPGSIQPDAMQRTVATVAATPAERREPVPCDAHGRPVRSTA